MRHRYCNFIVSCVALLAIALIGMPPARAADTTIKMNGFVSTTWFTQDEEFLFGNGQPAELPTTNGSNNLSGFDIRNTRVWWTMTGPDMADGWHTSGRLEADFFGGFNGTSAFSSSQATPRLRQAVMTLTSPDGRSQILIGQQWELMFPLDAVPKSLAHVAFPLGFATGMVGWRYPGVVWKQKLNTAAEGEGQWRFDLGAFSGQWNGPGSNVDYASAGNVDIRPQVEARLHYGTSSLTAYGTVYYSKQDLSGVSGNAATPIKDSITSSAITLGANWHPGDWHLLGAVYSGTGIGQIFGSMAQFGDIQTTGGYVQGGYQFTPHWQANLTFAQDKPDENDVITWLGAGSAGRLKGEQTALNLIYSDGPFGMAFEYMHAKLDGTTTGVDSYTNKGNQFSISAMFHF